MTQTVDRERASLQAIIDALLPNYLYTMVWTYRVTGSDGTGPVTISGKSQDPRMPDQARIVLRPGPDGGYSTPPNGSEIAIGFLNGDPERPYVHSLDPTTTSENAWLPITTKTKVAGGGPASARVGDTVNCGYLVFNTAAPPYIDSYYPGTPTGLSNANSRVSALSPNGLLIAMGDIIDGVHPGPGTIVTGSSKVEVGP